MQRYDAKGLFKNLYYALVYPHLIYGIEIYANTAKCNIDKLNVLNNKILRILQCKWLDSNVFALYSNYNTLPIQMMHAQQILLFTQKFMHHKELLPSIFSHYFLENQTLHDHNTRRCTDLHLLLNYTSYGHRCIIHKGSQLWDNLPIKLKTKQPVNTFKKSLYDYMCSLLLT